MTAAVTRAEGNLLTVARVAVGLVPAPDAQRLLETALVPPERLGPTARRLLEDTLSRGLVLALARQGGWLGVDGTRQWERAPAPPLHFGPDTVRLLSWVAGTPLSVADVPPLVLQGPLSPAEQALAALLLDALRGAGCAQALARQAALRRAPLVVLAHAAELARAAPLEAPPPVDVRALGPFVEGLRRLLARSWVAAERSKGLVAAPAELLRMGRAQAAALDAFLAAADGAGRHELATFLVDAAVTLVPSLPGGDALARGLRLDGPLRERTDARRAAGAFLRALATLHGWHQAHRLVRHFDEGYEAAQALARDWGRLGEPGFARAAALVAELDAIPTLPASP